MDSPLIKVLKLFLVDHVSRKLVDFFGVDITKTRRILQYIFMIDF